MSSKLIVGARMLISPGAVPAQRGKNGPSLVFIFAIMGGVILTLAWFVVGMISSPRAEIEKRVRQSVPLGTEDTRVIAFLDGYRMDHGTYSRNADGTGYVEAWRRNAYYKVGSGFPQPVDVIVKFRFDAAKRLISSEIAEKVISL